MFPTPIEPCPANSSAQDPGDAWRFAELDGLVEFLEIAAQKGRFIPYPSIPFTAIPSQEVCEAVLASLETS